MFFDDEIQQETPQPKTQKKLDGVSETTNPFIFEGGPPDPNIPTQIVRLVDGMYDICRGFVKDNPQNMIPPFTALIGKEGGLEELIQMDMSSEENKDDSCRRVRESIEKNDPDFIIQVSEVWMTQKITQNDHEAFRKDDEGNIYPEEGEPMPKDSPNRLDCLMVIVTYRGGKVECFTEFLERDQNGNRRLPEKHGNIIAMSNDGNQMHGRMNFLLKD